MKHSYTYVKASGIGALLVLGIAGGWWWGSTHPSAQSSITLPVEVRDNSAEYSYINPLLFSRVSKKFYEAEYQDLVEQLSASIQGIVANKEASSVSIYFRDLTSGHWTGIDEDKKYHPSSMLKVLEMMSYYHKQEDEPDFTLRRMYYMAEDDKGQYYKPAQFLQPGYYSPNELIEQMIRYSDNTVLKIFDREDEDFTFSKAYHALRLPLGPDDEIDGTMSPRSYSALFRILYNSTYLSRPDSEKALKLLTRTTFDRGITAGIPQSIAVAHKFGEHTYEVGTGGAEERELHDCGIVYYPLHPYLVCIMTSGTDFPHLEKVISGLSKKVYEYVDKKVKKN